MNSNSELVWSGWVGFSEGLGHTKKTKYLRRKSLEKDERPKPVFLLWPDPLVFLCGSGCFAEKCQGQDSNNNMEARYRYTTNPFSKHHLGHLSTCLLSCQTENRLASSLTPPPSPLFSFTQFFVPRSCLHSWRGWSTSRNCRTDVSELSPMSSTEDRKSRSVQGHTGRLHSRN